MDDIAGNEAPEKRGKPKSETPNSLGDHLLLLLLLLLLRQIYQ